MVVPDEFICTLGTVACIIYQTRIHQLLPCFTNYYTLNFSFVDFSPSPGDMHTTFTQDFDKTWRSITNDFANRLLNIVAFYVTFA